MPSAEIRIEHVNQNWLAEVEVGGMVSRRRMLRADDFEGIMRAVVDAYLEFVPQEAPKRATLPDVPLEPVTPPPSRVKTRVQVRRGRGLEGKGLRYKGARIK